MLTRPLAVLALLLLCSAILLRANFNQPFYNFDDEEHFRHAVSTPVPQLFNFKADYTFLPVSALSLRLDRALFGPPRGPIDIAEEEARKGGGFVEDRGIRSASDLNYFGEKNWAPFVRIESAIYHALAAFLLWLFLKRLNVSAGIALFVALAWAVHPMACESVCWVSERKNVLAALFGFAPLFAQTLREKPWRWPLVTILFLLSALSKPTGVGFFPVIAVFELIARPRQLPGLLGPLAVTIFIVLVGLNGHQQFFVTHPGGSLFTALLTDLEIFARYLFNIFIPINLSFFYGVDPIRGIADARVWLYGILLIGLVAATIAAAKENQRALVIAAWFWFFGALGPTSNLAPIPYWMQDRYAYFSAPGALLALALAAHGRAAILSKILGPAFVCTLAILSFIRSPLFRDSQTLAADAAARQPLSGRAHLEHGRNFLVAISNNQNPLYQQSGAKLKDTQAALAEFDAAMRAPDIDNFFDVFELRVNSAELMAGIGLNARAREHLKDWLPPKHLKLADPSRPYTAGDQGKFYKPQTLAYAWLVMAIARHNQAQKMNAESARVEDVSTANLEALAEAERSIAVDVWAYQAFILKARILDFQIRLDTRRGDAASAKLRFQEAQKTLEKVPQNSPFFQIAKEMSARISPP